MSIMRHLLDYLDKILAWELHNTDGALLRLDSTWQQAYYNSCRRLEGRRNPWNKGPEY